MLSVRIDADEHRPIEGAERESGADEFRDLARLALTADATGRNRSPARRQVDDLVAVSGECQAGPPGHAGAGSRQRVERELDAAIPQFPNVLEPFFDSRRLRHLDGQQEVGRVLDVVFGGSREPIAHEAEVHADVDLCRPLPFEVRVGVLRNGGARLHRVAPGIRAS